MGKEYISYSDESASGTLSQSFLYNVFSWMFAGLLMTALVSYLFATSDSLIMLLFNESGGFTMLGYVAMFAPIGFVLLMSLGFNRLSYPALIGIFMIYAALMGMSMTFIFIVYTASSIYSTFLVSAGMFGVMAAYGYLTKTDLTRMGNILFMALIGMVIAGVVNFFMRSEMISYVISMVSVVVFTGLTAYDVQKLKRIGSGIEYGTEIAGKLAIMGALELYLDFINLFLALLRLFGNKK
jgi:FtsH-binding integral membrane protein